MGVFGFFAEHGGAFEADEPGDTPSSPDAVDTTSDEAVWAAVETVVVGLNTPDEPFGAIETGEREQLAENIDAVLTAAGVDVAALTARRGLDRTELTDAWRDW